MSSQLAPEIGYRKLQLVVACQHPGHTRTPAPAAPARAPGARGTKRSAPTDETNGRAATTSEAAESTVRAAQPWPGHDLQRGRQRGAHTPTDCACPPVTACGRSAIDGYAKQ